MQIDYEMSEQDFMEAQKLALRHLPNRSGRWIVRSLPFLGLFICLAALWKVVRSGYMWNSNVILPFGFGLFFLLSPWLMNQANRKMFRRNPIFQGQRSVTVDETGLIFTSPTASVKIKWDSIQNTVEDNTTFVLYQGGVVFHILPKRQLSQEQISELRDAFGRRGIRSEIEQ